MASQNPLGNQGQQNQPQEMSISDMRAAIAADSPQPDGENEGDPNPDSGDGGGGAGPDKNDLTDSQPASQDKGELPESGDNKGGSGTSAQGQENKGKFTPKEKNPDESANFQERFNKKTWEAHDERRKREAAERELQELRANKGNNQSQATDKPEDNKPATEFAEPKPVKKTVNRDDYDDIDSYLDARDHATEEHASAVAQWEIRKARFEDRQQQTREAAERSTRETEQKKIGELREAQTAYRQRIAASAEANPKVLEAVRGSAGQFLTAAGQAEFIMKSEYGPEIVLYVHEHPEESVKVAQTGDPREVERYLLRIEGRLQAGQKPAAPELAIDNKQRQKLPDPVVAAGGKSTPSTAIDLNDPNLPLDTWKKEFSRQLKAG